MAPQQLDVPARDRLIGGLPLQARHIDVNGIATAILEGGKGAPVVLLHGGIQAGGAVWWRTAPQLTASYRVIVPDLPGLGASEPAAQLNLDTVDAWLAGVLRLTCHEPATLVAHSAPGGMAAGWPPASPPDTATCSGILYSSTRPGWDASGPARGSWPR